MYGTIERLRLKPGAEAAALAEMARFQEAAVPGFNQAIVYRSDTEPNVYYIAVVFDSREAYDANARSPEQDERYRALMALADGAPEWHDGEVIHIATGPASAARRV